MKRKLWVCTGINKWKSWQRPWIVWSTIHGQRPCQYHGLYQDFHLFIPIRTRSFLFCLMDYNLLQSSCIWMLEFSSVWSVGACVSWSLCSFFFCNWSIVYSVVPISAVTWLTYTHIDILFFNIPFHYASSQDIMY